MCDSVRVDQSQTWITTSFEAEDVFQEDLFFNFWKVLAMQLVLGLHQTPHKLVMPLKRFLEDLLTLNVANKPKSPRGLWTPFYHLSELHWSTFSLRGEQWNTSITSCGIQKHSNLYAQRKETHQIDDEARLSWERNVKAWLASLSCSSSQAPTEWSTIFAFGI